MRFDQSETITELALALSKAQSEIMKAHKDSKNPFFKSKYADLTSVWDAIREPLTHNGLSVAQFPLGEDGLVTILMHKSGQWMRGEFQMKPVKDDPQGRGSCITYMRRYALQAITGVCPEDDDGNAASRGIPNYKATDAQKLVFASVCKELGVTDRDQMNHYSQLLAGSGNVNMDNLKSAISGLIKADS